MSQLEGKPAQAGSITITELLALNDEITALVRAGVPLERGLWVAARDLRGRLKRIAGALARRLSRGESLPDALAGEGRSIPPLYRAVVEAGARSGRLGVALEGLARYVRGYSEARTSIGLALWYPMLIITLAYGLFVGLVWEGIPRFLAAFETLGVPAAAPLHWLAWIGESARYWWPAGPILLAILAIGWVISGTSARFHGSSWSWLRLFPWMKSLLASYETAGFTELLALLLEHNVAYSEALVLAAEATGNRRMARAANELAASIVCGEAPAQAIRSIDQRAFLPMVRWVLAAGQQQGSLVTSLRTLADLYRNRAQFQAQKMAIFLPTIAMLVIGASATLLYGLALFVPLVNLLRGLTLGGGG
jgi:type II secretory pathway component PulF